MKSLDRRNFSRLATVGGAAALLTACGAQAAKINTSLSTAAGAVTTATASVPVTAAQAVNLYGIAKGIGEVALTALALTPGGAPIAAIITAAFAAADPIVKDLPTIAGDVAELGTAVSNLIKHTNDILLAAAPSITAVANAV